MVSEHLEELYNENYNSVFSLCASIVGNDHRFYPLIEDCIQEAFIKAIIHYKEFCNYKNPMGWIAIAAVNKLKSELRKEAMHHKIVIPLSSDERERTIFFVDNIDYMLEQESTIQKLTQIYEMLTEHEKKIFMEYFVEEKRMKRISKETGFSMNSVRSAVNRIRKRARAVRNLLIIFIMECILEH